MAFKNTSGWNKKTELQAYLIFRKAFEKNFPRGYQAKLCEELAKESKLLDKGNISAKVCNYKSEAGINKPSRSSIDTKNNYIEYADYSINEIERIINILNDKV